MPANGKVTDKVGTTHSLLHKLLIRLGTTHLLTNKTHIIFPLLGRGQFPFPRKAKQREIHGVHSWRSLFSLSSQVTGLKSSFANLHTRAQGSPNTQTQRL